MSAPPPLCIPLPTPNLNSTYGAMLIGVLFSTFLQGVLTLQTVTYYDSYPKDPISTKLVVATVWCFDTFHLILIAQSAYHYLISNWGFLPALLESTWELDLNVTFIGLSTFACQLFFLKRIWVFSGRNWIMVGVLAALCCVTLVVDIIVTVQILEHRSVAEFGVQKTGILVAFISGAVADVTIASLLTFYIRRNRSGFEKTDSLITLIVRYTVTTGVVTSLLGIFTLVAYFLSPDGLTFIAMHFCLGRLYTNALLATLNSRSKLRATLEGTSNVQFDSSRKKDNSTNLSMSIPLSNFSSAPGMTDTQPSTVNVQVHKATEVLQDQYIYNQKRSLEENAIRVVGV
ncbi:hypothetical protein BDP27DRAFT_1333391 [Rhodocollybia butyracea]|uniref:DUF6534 domain-containing protein n=1 Tax=Rhodocollybia butyracea TaxID=206335 RepID=A0A9P5PJV2_9AGAR|nr:hypothetical protein BDP27DRAFT_1333391 [Rhodocollybia butyracea]